MLFTELLENSDNHVASSHADPVATSNDENPPQIDEDCMYVPTDEEEEISYVGKGELTKDRSGFRKQHGLNLIVNTGLGQLPPTLYFCV